MFIPEAAAAKGHRLLFYTKENFTNVNEVKEGGEREYIKQKYLNKLDTLD